MIDIIIPTIKTKEEIQKQIDDIASTCTMFFNLIPTCTNASAAVNRNIGLDRAKNGLILMLDDDITGFYKGWDKDLIEPLLTYGGTMIVSARLLKPDGSIGNFMNWSYSNSREDWIEIREKEVPTACIAFRNNDLRFDENYIGSGFEDNDICRQYQLKYPEGKFILNNKCKLIHLNEMKNQKDDYWKHNQAYYKKKWGLS